MNKTSTPELPGNGSWRSRLSNLFRTALLFAFFYVLALLAFFPADAAWRLLSSPLGWQPQWIGGTLNGTIWRGSAPPLQVSNTSIEQVQWHWQPLDLLRGRFTYRISLHAAGQPWTLQTALGVRDLEVRISEVMLPAQWLNEPFDWPLALAGTITLEKWVVRLDTRLQLQDLSGTLFWNEAGAGFPQALPLGHYTADLMLEERHAVAHIRSLSGSDLGVTGAARWLPSGDLELDLLFLPQESLAPSVRSFLEALAEPEGEGRFRLRFEQTVPL